MRTDDIRNAVRYLDKLLDGEKLTLEEAIEESIEEMGGNMDRERGLTVEEIGAGMKLEEQEQGQGQDQVDGKTMAEMEEQGLTGLTGLPGRKMGEPIEDGHWRSPKKRREGDVLDGAHDKRTDPLFQHKIGFIPFAYHLVPPRGLAKVSSVMRKGEREGRGDNWKEVSVEEHLNHAISHIVAYFAGQKGKHNLANAGCRILMALDLDNSERLPFVPVSPVGP